MASWQSTRKRPASCAIPMQRCQQVKGVPSPLTYLATTHPPPLSLTGNQNAAALCKPTGTQASRERPAHRAHAPTPPPPSGRQPTDRPTTHLLRRQCPVPVRVRLAPQRRQQLGLSPQPRPQQAEHIGVCCAPGRQQPCVRCDLLQRRARRFAHTKSHKSSSPYMALSQSQCHTHASTSSRGRGGAFTSSLGAPWWLTTANTSTVQQGRRLCAAMSPTQHGHWV